MREADGYTERVFEARNARAQTPPASVRTQLNQLNHSSFTTDSLKPSGRDVQYCHPQQQVVPYISTEEDLAYKQDERGALAGNNYMVHRAPRSARIDRGERVERGERELANEAQMSVHSEANEDHRYWKTVPVRRLSRSHSATSSWMSICLFLLVGIILGVIIGTTVLLAQQQRHPAVSTTSVLVYAPTPPSPPSAPQTDWKGLAKQHPHWTAPASLSLDNAIELDQLKFRIGEETFFARPLLEDLISTMQRAEEHLARTNALARSKHRMASSSSSNSTLSVHSALVKAAH